MLKTFYGLTGSTANIASAVANIIKVDPTTSGVLAAELGVGDWTYLAIKNLSDVEIVRVTGVAGQNLTVVRNVEGTGAFSFPNGSTVCFTLSAAAVNDIIDVSPTVQATVVTINGTGSVTVVQNSPNNFTISSPIPVITGVNIDINGTYPTWEIAASSLAGACCGGSGGSGGSTAPITITGFDAVSVVEVLPGSFQVSAPIPSFAGQDGINIFGSWPSYSIGFSGGGGGGSVQIVTAGDGVVVTGNPTLNPTVGLTPYPLVAGYWGNIRIDGVGRIMEVPTGFNFLGAILTSEPAVTITPGPSTSSIAIRAAAEGVTGIVALADGDNPIDPLDRTTAVTPYMLALAVASAGTLDGGQSYVGESPALYTNVVASSTPVLALAAGEQALILGSVSILDTAAPTVPVAYGLTILVGAAIVGANKIIPQCQQNLSYIVTGPLVGTLTMATTALAGTAGVTGSSLQVVKL